MAINCRKQALLQTAARSNSKWGILLPLCFLLFPSSAVAQQAVLSVVKSQENANQWTGITTRLQVAGVSYCVVDWPAVKNAADLGSTAVLFLPNVEVLTPVQAIALEEWMGRGGRVIASGPVGELSQPGVRQLLRSLLGSYWGFSLSTPSNLQPLQSTTQEWLRQTGLSGTVKRRRLDSCRLNQPTRCCLAVSR